MLQSVPTHFGVPKPESALPALRAQIGSVSQHQHAAELIFHVPPGDFLAPRLNGEPRVVVGHRFLGPTLGTHRLRIEEVDLDDPAAVFARTREIARVCERVRAATHHDQRVQTALAVDLDR
jgi:hypothetical protein